MQKKNNNNNNNNNREMAAILKFHLADNAGFLENIAVVQRVKNYLSLIKL
jgi:hypothetical protein